MDYLKDKEFLKQLDSYQNHEIYVRITALTIDEAPIEMIEGKTTGGSISIDGTSAIRRTCSISMIAYDVNINDFYWGLNNKFTLEIGLRNFINSNYPEIIWFKQGTYLITSFTASLSENNFSISITGKDKMCLVNGELGGSLPASIDFGTIEITKDNGDIVIERVPVKKIIRQMLHTYAQEPYHNIVIKDLDTYGLELLEYRSETPMYLFYDVGSNNYIQYTYNGEMKCYIVNGKSEPVSINSSEIKYNSRFELIDKEYLGTKIKLLDGETIYTISKIQYGDTVGYRLTDLTYPGDLISNPGDAITAILDKLTSMLGNFEYFYDLEGRFIFQKKKTYVDTVWTPIVKGDYDRYVEDAMYAEDEIAYYFNNGNLVKTFQNSPNLTNLKNDYTIWGTRKGASGVDLPIHYRYAIHKKPQKYVSMQIDSKSKKNIVYTTETHDWRELIYQMAIDYDAHNQDDDYTIQLINNNPEMCQNGRTGYEQFYIDMQGFWRQLYNPTSNAADPWNAEIKNNPDLLNFWIDFLDSTENGVGSELDAYSIFAVGDRAKVVNDNDVKSIYFRDIPNLIFTTLQELEKYDNFSDMTGYTFAFLDQSQANFSYFTISSQGKSAKEALDELFYNHSYCVESITLNTIPIYYLQPNTKIIVNDENSKINGEYIMTRITIPLAINGTMNITATKAPQTIY